MNPNHPHDMAFAAYPATMAMKGPIIQFPHLVQPTMQLPTNADIDSLLQVHRRKMLRRAANRRSAQLSRARKKAHLEDLKVENMRLQRYVDLLDSLPDLIFSLSIDGRINHVTERTLNFVREHLYDGEDDLVHMSQLLTSESMESLLLTLQQVASAALDPQFIAPVKEICFMGRSSYHSIGYMRCSKVLSKRINNEEEASLASSNGESKDKESGTSVSKNSRSQSPTLSESRGSMSSEWEVANVISTLSSKTSMESSTSSSQKTLSHSSSACSGVEADNDSTESPRQDSDAEDEFICVIRPADASVPNDPNSSWISPAISQESIIAHKRKLSLSSSNIGADPVQTGTAFTMDPTAISSLSTSGSGSGSGSGVDSNNKNSSNSNSSDASSDVVDGNEAEK